jgi:hypothetical protein
MSMSVVERKIRDYQERLSHNAARD